MSHKIVINDKQIRELLNMKAVLRGPYWEERIDEAIARRIEQLKANEQSHDFGARGIAPVCDCGAKHTSFPQHHLHWCTMAKAGSPA